MTERERVIKAFEFCLMPPNEKEILSDICSHEDCPYYREYNGGKCMSAAVSDALALLKAQEPVEPTIGRCEEYDGHDSWWYQCGKCKTPIDVNDKYCRMCGRAVKWE